MGADNTMSTIEDDVMVKINFDGVAEQVAALKALIFQTPETNHTKLQFIKEELAAGRYEIHSQHIASKLLEHALPTMVELELA